ncbi:hypothetical protein MLD38_040595 [Melastoma candidum]|nr:hypothetical protein MLD38_040595 [Melastoma candidum]
MADPKKMAVSMVVVIVALSLCCMSVERVGVGAQVHHVVGGDRGWESGSDVRSWSKGRIFRVGDKLWFAYSAAQGSIMELRSEEEYEACDVSNPIRMYTDGIDRVPLEEEGARYFASSEGSSCRDGLRIHVEVRPRGDAEEQPGRKPGSFSEEAGSIHAAGPVSPSMSFPMAMPPILLIISGILCSASLLLVAM